MGNATQGAGVEPFASIAGRRASPGEWLGLALVCAAAFGLRVWNLGELAAHDPFFERPSVDARMYHEWAQQIAGGDWVGEGVFLNGPLYPYALGLLYALFGPSLWVAKLAQALLGTASVALTWAIGRRLFSPGVALGGAALLGASAMPIFYEGTLVVANLLLPLGLLALWAVIEARRQPGAWRWAVAGIAVGMGALARPNLLLLGALCAGWAWFALGEHARGRRARWLAAYALGALLCIAPVTLRNLVVGGDFVPITYAGGLNLFVGNNPDSDGSFRVPGIFPRSAADDPWEQRAIFRAYAEQFEGRALRPSEVSRFWSGQALRFARERPADWLRVMGRKLALSISGFEAWNIRSITLTRDFSAVLRLPLVEFAWLAPLALLGIWLGAARWRELVPLYALLATVFATMWIFFVLSRYRIPAYPALALFASFGLAESWRRLRGGAAKSLIVPIVAALALAIAGRAAPASEDLSIAYYNLANSYRSAGDWTRAVDAYQEALERRPEYVSSHNNLALTYEAMGREEEARRAWRRVRELARAQGLPAHVERAERHLAELGAQ